jgi:hypothetical protein
MTTRKTTRRAILAGASAAAVAVPLAASSAHGAATNWALLETRWRAALAAHGDHEGEEAVWRQVDDRFPPPDVLRATPEDRALGIDPPSNDRTHYVAPYDISRLEASHVYRAVQVTMANGESATEVRCFNQAPELQARAREIIPAWRSWNEAKTSAAEDLGLEEAEQERNDLLDRLTEVEREVWAAPVTTFADAVAKARLACVIMDYYNLAAGAEFGETDTEDEIAHKLIRDIAAMQA